MTNGPLFIIGCPRSGTTLLLDLLAGTRAFGFVSTSGTRRDVDESLHGRTRIYDTPLLGDLLYNYRSKILGATSRLGPLAQVARRRLPSAIEPWEFWEDLIPSFRPEWSDGRALDPSATTLDQKTIERARTTVAELLERQGRTMLLSKYTDFPRVELMRTIFPAAKFVHIRRDPHAVANSYAVEIESGRFGTWDYREWWGAEWSEKARIHWRSTGETVLGFTAHNRNRLVELIDAELINDPGAMTVGYEQLIEDPVGELASILTFAGVASRANLERLARSRRLSNTNDRWRAKRSVEETALLDTILMPADARDL